MPKVNLVQFYQYTLLFLSFSFSFPETLAPISFALLAISSLLLRITKKNWKFQKQITWLFVAIFTYYAIRIIGNDNVKYGFRVLERNLPLLIVPIFVIPAYIGSKKKYYKAFIIGIVSAAIYTILMVAYSQLINKPSTDAWFFQSIRNYGFHPTYMAVYALIALVMLVEAELFSIRLRMILGVFLTAFIVFSSSRISMIILTLLFIIKAIKSRQKIYLYAIVLFSAFIIGLFSFSADFRFKINQLADFKGFEHYDNNNYGAVSVRVAKIKSSLILWGEHPWFGAGTGDFREDLVQVYRSPEVECWPCAKARYNSHNQYLNTLAAHGVFGFILFVLLYAYLFWNAFKYKNTILLGFLIIIIITALTESIYEVSRGVTLFFFLMYYLSIQSKRDELVN